MKRGVKKGAFLSILLAALPGFLPGGPPLGSFSGGEARSKLLAAAEAYLGSPYRYGGLDRRGLDCSALVYLSFRDALGAAVPRTTGALYNWAEKIPDEARERGDLVFFRDGGGIFHVGIYAGEGRFIHTASSGPATGVIYSRLEESFWRRRYAGAGRALSPGAAGAGARRLPGSAPGAPRHTEGFGAFLQ
jgi:probable lipoprotein NlpC